MNNVFLILFMIATGMWLLRLGIKIDNLEAKNDRLQQKTDWLQRGFQNLSREIYTNEDILERMLKEDADGL